MSVIADTKLIAPHGGTLVERAGGRPDDVETLEVVTLTSRELSDLDMIASGALSPLEGFMGREDYEAVLDTMRLALLVVLVRLVDLEYGEELAALVRERNPVASGRRVDGEADG